MPDVHRQDRRRGASRPQRQATCSRRSCSSRRRRRATTARSSTRTRPAAARRSAEHGRARPSAVTRAADAPRRTTATTAPTTTTVTAVRDGRALARWYREHGRHDLPWRATRDRWLVLVSEVMLHQTQAPRVAPVYDAFVAQFPTPAASRGRGPGGVIAAWGRLGYPRRARWLWEAAARSSTRRLARRPHRAARRRPLHRGRGRRAGRRRRRDRHRGEHPPRVRTRARRRGSSDTRGRGSARVEIAAPLRGRDRLLALMDLGATVCTRAHPRATAARSCAICATRGTLADETKHRQAAYAGSFRQRRGIVLARLRAGPVARGRARRRSARVAARRRPRGSHARPRAPSDVARPARADREEVAQEVVPAVGEDRLGVELHALDRELAVAQAHHQPVLGLGGDLEHVGNRIALDDERVVARRGERARQAGEHADARRGGSPTSCRASRAARARRCRRRARRCTAARGTRRAPERPARRSARIASFESPASPGRPGPGEIEHRVGREVVHLVERDRVVAVHDRLRAELTRGTARGCRRTSRSCRSRARGSRGHSVPTRGPAGPAIILCAVPESKSKRIALHAAAAEEGAAEPAVVRRRDHDVARWSACSSWSPTTSACCPATPRTAT